jgi:hypothetical protein
MIGHHGDLQTVFQCELEERRTLLRECGPDRGRRQKKGKQTSSSA